MSHFDEMQMFVRIVDAGSISKAADQLGVAKSGVSRRLADLERRLGVKLINRTTRRSSLTEAGTAYYRGAVALLANVAELDASVASSEATLKGVLHVAVPLSFGLGHLAPAIREFIAANPAVDVHIDFSDRRIDLVEQGVSMFFGLWHVKNDYMTSGSLGAQILYRGIFSTFVVPIWLAWIATILGLVTTAGVVWSCE